jgi:uncharacterized protein YlxW (UPF0749 family)
MLRRAGPAALVGVLAFVLTLNLRVQENVVAATAQRRTELASVVEARQRRSDSLERTLAGLRARLERTASRSNVARLRSLADEVAELSAVSGGAAVEGPAVVVTLRDAADAGADDADFRIQDVDAQVVVNELWLAGAEAIAINGQRLVATSAIRNAGAAVLVNYRVLTSPYRITAVGPVDGVRSRFAASETARRFARWQDIYGLGFSIETTGEARLPAFSEPTRLRYAEPIREP